MEKSASSSRMIRCGAFEIDLRAFELRKHGLRLKLSEQPFQILAILLEKPGQVVTREEIRTRLWPGDTFVDFDHGLNNAVMRLREALADSSDRPRFVETLPRRGYRFIAPIEEVRSPAQDAPAVLWAAQSVADFPHPDPIVESPSDAPRIGGRGNLHRWLTLPRIALLSAAVLAFAAFSGLAVHYVRGMESARVNPAHAMSLVVLPL